MCTTFEMNEISQATTATSTIINSTHKKCVTMCVFTLVFFSIFLIYYFLCLALTFHRSRHHHMIERINGLPLNACTLLYTRWDASSLIFLNSFFFVHIFSDYYETSEWEWQKKSSNKYSKRKKGEKTWDPLWELCFLCLYTMSIRPCFAVYTILKWKANANDINWTEKVNEK